MKISTKFAICFAVMALLPLAVASAIYLRSSSEFGKEMTERGQALLAERLTRDLKRATEQGAVSFEKLRRDLLSETRFLARNAIEHLNQPFEEANEESSPTSFDIEPAKPNSDGKKIPIHLGRMQVSIADDASRDEVAGMLRQLNGISQSARTIYLRNRDLIDTISISLEMGLHASYPSGAAHIVDDPREQDWYLHSLESGKPAWFTHPRDKRPAISVTVPLQQANGILAGITKVSIKLAPLLERILSSPHLPAEASAYLLAVPDDDPELMPHLFARLDARDGQWLVTKETSPLLLDGDDTWLKVVSDIRTGVPGLEFVERQGEREVWSFGPIGRAGDATLHLAVSLPESIINEARARADKIVRAAYKEQIRYAVVLAVLTGIVAITFAIFAARSLTNPIRRLHAAATKLASGDFSVRVDAGGRDELGALAEGFNSMVPALEEQVRVKQDLHIAEEIQQHLVGDKAITLPGFDIAGKTVYCDETGGDYLDFIELPDRQMLVLSGDVTGHGVGAAILMATARAIIRTNARQFDSPQKLISTVNKQLAEDVSGGRSLSLFYACLKADERSFNWFSAGHDPVLIFDQEIDEFVLLEGEDIPLGVDSSWDFTGKSFRLPKKGLLIATTDGVREAKNARGEQYGLERLKGIVRRSSGHTSSAIIQAVLDDLETFRDGARISDDVSILLIRPI